MKTYYLWSSKTKKCFGERYPNFDTAYVMWCAHVAVMTALGRSQTYIIESNPEEFTYRKIDYMALQKARVVPE